MIRSRPVLKQLYAHANVHSASTIAARSATAHAKAVANSLSRVESFGSPIFSATDLKRDVGPFHLISSTSANSGASVRSSARSLIRIAQS